MSNRFAHLMASFLSGAAPTAAAAGKDKDGKVEGGEECAEKPVKRDDESDEEFEKRLKEWEDENPDGKKGKKAEEKPKDTTEDGPEKPDDKVKKAEQTGFANGFKAANDRWADVMASTAVVGRMATACNLLAETEMSAASIVKALEAMPKENARTTLHQRQAGKETPAPGAGDGSEAPKGPKAFAAKMQAVRDRVAGKTPAAA